MYLVLLISIRDKLYKQITKQSYLRLLLKRTNLFFKTNVIILLKK